jgi:carboxymethylenebutenolidase
MTRKTAKDFHPRLLEMFDGYVHGDLSKRGFLKGAGQFAVGGVTAAALLEALSPDYALAQEVAADDPDIETARITYASPDGHGVVSGLLAHPAREGVFGAVLVVHENRGLNPYIEDVARRVAKAGYLALAPDGLTSLGGYPGNDDDGRVLQRQLDGAALLEDFFAGFEFVRDHPRSNGKAGAVGFCYGGGVCNALAVAYPDMACSVPFYGRHASAEDVPAIQAPLLLHFTETDTRINAGWPAYEEALTANGKTFEAHLYAEVGHGFHNNTTPRYDAEAAALAWGRTLDWFETYLTA